MEVSQSSVETTYRTYAWNLESNTLLHVINKLLRHTFSFEPLAFECWGWNILKLWRPSRFELYCNVKTFITYGINCNAKRDGFQCSKSLRKRLLSSCERMRVGVCVDGSVWVFVWMGACVRVCGRQIAQILDFLSNNYKNICFHTRTTYINSPGRPSHSSNLSLVRRFRNEKTKIITNWKEKQKETLNDSLKWILSHELHKQHRMRRKTDSQCLLYNHLLHTG